MISTVSENLNFLWFHLTDIFAIAANNGKEQPGCALSQESSALIPLTLIKDGIEEASRVLLACNHVRAIKLFTDSINGKCPYVAHRCPSYQHFMAGKCFKCTSGNCALMGYHSTLPITSSYVNNVTSENDIDTHYPIAPQPGKYFLATGKEPMCRKFPSLYFKLEIHTQIPSSRTPLSIHGGIGETQKR